MSDPANTTQSIKNGDDTRVQDQLERDTPIELEPDVGGDRERLHGMPKEYSGWDVYNNEAKKVDTELVNDWTASLNSLLLFAAIFAAVLTAFIVESKKLLEHDPSDAMLDVMIFVANNLANGNHTVYFRPEFEPESYAVVVNCLLFASLSTSLVAALASVVALQWVADYDAAITRGGSSPEDRAKRRQFRYAGVLWWKMGEIIAALPLLLYCSVVLFFSGLVAWMWIVNHSVGAVVSGGMGMAVLFYGVTTVLSVVSVSAPFRTPLSRLIYSSFYLFLSTIDSLSRLFPVISSQTGLKGRRQRYLSAVRRENDEVNRRSMLGMDSLVWLANHLSISLDSYDRLLLLVNELRKQDLNHFTYSGFKEAPWFSIFDLLAWRHLNTAGPDEDISKEEIRVVATLAHCYRIPAIYAIIRPKESLLYCSDDTEDEYWAQYCEITRPQWSPPSPSIVINSLFLLFRDIPLPLEDTLKHVDFTIRLSRWRNSPKTPRKPLGGNVRRDMQAAALSQMPPTASAVVVGRLLRENEDDLWFTRGDRSLYSTTVGRMVSLCVSNGGSITPRFLDTLRWRFEAILLEEGHHSLDHISCLSRPLLYGCSLRRHETEDAPLHGHFTLLLARNIYSHEGAEKVRRVKEVLTMMWLSSTDFSQRTPQTGPGMESFFDANRRDIMTWSSKLELIPHIYEVLKHVIHAQYGQEPVRSLCQVLNSGTNLRELISVLKAFDRLISMGATPEQHLFLIDVICRGIEHNPPVQDTPTQYWGQTPLEMVNELKDTCLTIIGKLVVQAEFEIAREHRQLTEPLLRRIAKHLLFHYEQVDFPFMHKLKAYFWRFTREDGRLLCWRARHEPETLARLKQVFKHPMKCYKCYYGERREGYYNGDAHLLCHLIGEDFEFPVNIPARTEVPMQGVSLDPFMMALILSDGDGSLLEHILQNKSHIQDQCMGSVIQMINDLKMSQHSLLTLVMSWCQCRYNYGTKLLYTQILAAFSICINIVVELPKDHRTAPLIPQLMSETRRATSVMVMWDKRFACAAREAQQALDRLDSQLATMLVFGRHNFRVLSCARTQTAFSPATGWLAPCTD